jgi:hypothetical protein
MGRETIEHALCAHDEVANVVAGVVHLVLKKPRPQALVGLGGKVFNRDGMTIADSISHHFDKFKPKPAPTSNDELHRANCRQQHEEMKLRIEGPPRPPVELSPDAQERLKKFEAELERERTGIGNLHGKFFHGGNVY